MAPLDVLWKVLNKETIRIEESLNVTFEESLPEPKSSSSVEDDRIDEPIVQDLNGSPSLLVNVSDEGYPKSLKEARGENCHKLTTTVKLPYSHTGEFDMWRLRIGQILFKYKDYALWKCHEMETHLNLQLKQQQMLMNKPDLDTMRFDDLYNNFKIVKQEIKGTATSSSSSSSQNVAFVSSPRSTNEVNTFYGVSTANTHVSPTSTQVSTASTQISTANLCDDTVYAFLASQPTGSQLVHEDLEQIHEDDLEEMDLKWQLALLSMRTKSSRRTVNMEETSSKAMLAIDEAGFDWSYMADDEVPTNMALMAFSDSELEKLKQEKESNQLKIEKFDNASKSLDKLIGSQITDKSRKGMGFVSYNAIPPPPIGLFSLPNLDLSNSGLEEFQQPEFEGYGPKTRKNVSEDTSNEVRESVGIKRLQDDS
ncbi:hypothetical protein Tco_0864468 [Tanacetum coccineum]